VVEPVQAEDAADTRALEVAALREELAETRELVDRIARVLELHERLRARVEEVPEHGAPVGGEDALRVELDALDGMRAVSHAHHLPVFGPRGDLELAGDTRCGE